jgi:hypothetical protein
MPLHGRIGVWAHAGRCAATWGCGSSQLMPAHDPIGVWFMLVAAGSCRHMAAWGCGSLPVRGRLGVQLGSARIMPVHGRLGVRLGCVGVWFVLVNAGSSWPVGGAARRARMMSVHGRLGELLGCIGV